MVKFCLLFILLKIKKKKKSFLCLPALCQSVRLYCEVIQPLSLGVEWWNKSHSTGSLSLLCLHFAAAALVQSASACMTFIVLLIGELHLLIIKRNIYRIAHAHLFFFFFFAFVCLCVYVCFQTSTKSSKLFTFTLPWLSRSQTWSHGNTSTNQPLKLCPQPLIVACRVSRDDLIPVGFEKNQTTIRSVLHSQSNRGLCHGSQKQTGGGQRAVFCGGSWWCRVRSWGR